MVDHTTIQLAQRLWDHHLYQDIPEEVWQAYERLVNMGYDKHLI